MDEAVMPLPRPEITPPVTKIYFIVSMGADHKGLDYLSFPYQVSAKTP